MADTGSEYGFAQDDGNVAPNMDSKCDQHVFNDMRRFPFGVTPELNVVVKTAEKGVPPIVARGKGNAIVVAAISGAVIEFTKVLSPMRCLCPIWTSTWFPSSGQWCKTR
eukprot:3569088-Pleurochrysis_carterae.AAC.1